MADRHEPARLDAATLAAYLEGRLPPEDRARVDAEIARDPETYEWVVNALRLSAAADDEQLAVDPTPGPEPDPAPHPVPEPEPAPSPVVPFHRRRAVRTGIGALLATAAALVLMVRVEPGVWQRWMGGSDVDPRFTKLVEAVGEERYIEARLTGGFKYGPLRSVTRGPGDLSSKNLALLAAAGELQKKAQEDPSAENLHAWGVAQVLLGDYDAAVATLELAADHEPVASALLGDLTAAYLTRAIELDRADDLPRALALAERAAGEAAAGPEVFSNQALVLEALGLDTEALSSWQEALRRESRPDWRAYLERRLARLRSAPIPRDRQGQLLERLDDITRQQPDRSPHQPVATVGLS